MSQITTTARDLIRRSLKLISVLGEGENPSDSESQDALMTLNEIVDKWNTESLMSASYRNITIPLVYGQTKYTIDDLPISGVDNAYSIRTNGFNQPVKILTKNEYESIPFKDQTFQQARYVYINASYPIADLYVFPAGGDADLILSVQDTFTIFPNLDTEINLNSGYVRALRFNLAVELCPEYSVQVPSNLVEQAVGAKGFIKDNNSKNKVRKMRTDGALNSTTSRWNVYTNSYYYGD